MTARLTPADRVRMARSGLGALLPEQALALLDAALAVDEPVLTPVRLDLAELRARTDPANIPPLLRGLVRVAPAGRPGSGLLDRLAAAPEADRGELILSAVRGQVAGVLGHATGDGVAPDRAFKELGFDSLTAVELRNRLQELTGLRLSPTLAFDHPHATALARHLETGLFPRPADPVEAVLAELDRIEGTFDVTSADPRGRGAIAERLQSLLTRYRDVADPDSSAEKLRTASDQEIFEFVDRELGRH